MKRLLTLCGLALVLAPTALAGATKASISLHQSSTDQTSGLGTVDFSVVLDKGSSASVAVECFTASGGVSYYQATGQFTVTPGVASVSPSLTIYGVTAGSSCSAWVYRFAPKQMIAASTSFVT